MINIYLSRLQEVFNEYQGIAANEDSQYRQWPPVLNSQEYSGLQEFPFDLEPPGSSLGNMQQRTSTRLSTTSKGLKWAFLYRRRYESMLEDFRKWTAKLKEIATPCMLDQISPRRPGGMST